MILESSLRFKYARSHGSSSSEFKQNVTLGNHIKQYLVDFFLPERFSTICPIQLIDLTFRTFPSITHVTI